VPRMSILVAQMLFSVVDIVFQRAVIGTTPTTGDYGTVPAKGEYLTAVALKSDVRLVPMVDPAEGDFDGVVVRFDPLDKAGHFHSSLPVV
jgi:acyl-coenzyme A thioesterase PaaI-like protein